MRTSFLAVCEQKLVAKATPTRSAVSLLVGVRLRTSFLAVCEERLVAKATPTRSGLSLMVGARLRTGFPLAPDALAR